MDSHQKFMLRALELAELGRGATSPNPMVGCVIVHEGKVIGEGYHEIYGGPHAEPNAIQSVQNKNLLPESTVYVTLEPCAHWGKTPPCANLLVEKQVKKVVVGALDSNPLVGGKGIQILRDAGIEVVTGILSDKIRNQNRRFFTYIEKKRPYILLKWAQTEDGFIARENYDSKWISSQYSRQLVHKWRSEEDAIMVGTLTAQYDNPKLNVRDWEGKNPVRVVIDRKLLLNPDLYLFDQSQATFCYNQIQEKTEGSLQHVKMEDGFDIEAVLSDLYHKKIQSILVEGGAQLLKKFIEKELWDEARFFTGNIAFGQGITAPKLTGVLQKEINIMGDKLQVFFPKR
ncbi:MAG: bifunctional diaminohydroxyphosphoribosylaminopyrimidine deaminase/5-amino-6-(5-phosphoribosylamino)uracil reductase RibD [Cyclobacteriaceae bacterium]|nr:bifunctional diaminohydroxyphosphoribosylaminopyrimidine deaminase/5-amino-6-(5-phosphoribosylamino)uracil reductase RibD [Cyclobacteriaceae bacterium]